MIVNWVGMLEKLCPPDSPYFIGGIEGAKRKGGWFAHTYRTAICFP